MSVLYERQDITTGDQDEFFYENGSFWWTTTGQIVRWSIFIAIFCFFVLYMLGGYWHAKRRISKGQTPLRYHRWLLSRQQRAQYDPNYQNPLVYYNRYPDRGQYGMHNMPPPPPMYDPNGMPPTYQPPAGGTKVDPSQWRAEPTERPAQGGEPSPSYEAPPGPPPAVLAGRTGASTTGNNPFRDS